MPKQAKKDTASMSFEDAVRQNKKQAKREAKLMLKLSEAKAEVQKAEKKLAKAQAQLETNRDNLRKVEESLNDLRQPDQPNKDKSRGETESASEQEHPKGVIFTTNQPEAGTEIETKIVNEILEGIFQASTSTETTDQPQEHAALKDYQGETPFPNLTADQPELEEKPADASHTYSQNQYEAGDTRPYPTGQGGLEPATFPAADNIAQNNNATHGEATQETSKTAAKSRTDVSAEESAQAALNASTEIPAKNESANGPAEGSKNSTDVEEGKASEESAEETADHDQHHITASHRTRHRRTNTNNQS